MKITFLELLKKLDEKTQPKTLTYNERVYEWNGNFYDYVDMTGETDLLTAEVGKYCDMYEMCHSKDIDLPEPAHVDIGAEVEYKTKKGTKIGVVLDKIDAIGHVIVLCESSVRYVPVSDIKLTGYTNMDAIGLIHDIKQRNNEN